ncbi:hypothetical protein Q7P37_003628 [Cladosporium fusiforme]
MTFKNILLFGAGGTSIGSYLLDALIEDGTFHVTVLARSSSKTTYPPSISVVRVPDALPHRKLVAALRTQEVVISTVGFSAQAEQYKLIDAAVEAGARFIPSEWGMDNADVNNQELCPIFKGKSEVEMYLRSKEGMDFSWTAVASSIWLDWALDVNFLDIDPRAHTAQYWSDGTHRPSLTTRRYCAEATLQLLKNPHVAKNQRIFLSPIEASQQQIVAALEKLQGVRYAISIADTDKIVQDAQGRWEDDQEVTAAYRLVTAGVLLPKYKADFGTSGKIPILEQMLEMPRLSLQDTLNQWVESYSETEN